MPIAKEVVQKAVADLKVAVVELKGKRGVLAILSAIPAVVNKVEQIGADLGFAGTDKKELALDIIFALLPPLPWWAPEFVVRTYAGVLIERAVAELNRILKK